MSEPRKLHTDGAAGGAYQAAGAGMSDQDQYEAARRRARQKSWTALTHSGPRSSSTRDILARRLPDGSGSGAIIRLRHGG